MVRAKKRNPRNEALTLDLIHIVIGLLVVVCAVLVFIDPERNQVIFPFIFWLAALLNSINAWVRLRGWSRSRDKRRKAAGVLLVFAALLLAAVGVVSALSMWR